MSAVTIRPAREDDAAFLARIALIASRAHIGWGFYDVWFPGNDDEHLARLTRGALTPGWFHHFSMRVIAEVDGVPAGSIAPFPATPEFWAGLGGAMAAALSEADMTSFLKNRAVTDTCPIAHPDRAWGIELVGVLPEFRGRGIGDLLLSEALDRGRAAGHTTASIIFEIDNAPAQRAYERAGFAAVEEQRHPDFERAMRTPGLRRVERTL